MADMTDWDSYDNTACVTAFVASSSAGLIVVALYVFFRYCRGRRGCCSRTVAYSQNSESLVLPSSRNYTAGSVGSQLGGLLPPADKTTPGRSQPKRGGSDDRNSAWDSWPTSHYALGVDLGSYSVKAHAIKSPNGPVGRLFTQRSVACMLDDALAVGDWHAALEPNAESIVAELPYELARREDCHLTTARGERHSFVQLLAEMIRRYVGVQDYVVGVSVPPQLNEVLAPRLYAVAASASLRRCFFFTQTAALSASVLHRRNTLSRVAGTTSAPVDRRPKPKWVVLADIGASGASIAICEMGEVSATCRREFYRREGPRPCIATAVGVITARHPHVTVWEAADAVHTLLHSYAGMEEYLKHQGASTQTTIRTADPTVDVHMSRADFGAWFQTLFVDLEALAQEATGFLSRIEGRRPDEAIEIVFHGGLFHIDELRVHFQTYFQNVRSVVRPSEVAVSEGLAILAAKLYPDKAHGHTYDVEPMVAIQPVPSRVRDAVLYAARPGLLRTASRLLNSAPSFAGAVQGSGQGTPYRRLSSLV
jgi:hypothetical protein